MARLGLVFFTQRGYVRAISAAAEVAQKQDKAEEKAEACSAASPVSRLVHTDEAENQP